MWFILALLAGVLFAANRLIFRAVFTRGTNPIVFLAAHELLAGLLLLPVALINFSLPHSGKTWLTLSLGVVLIFLADLFAALSLQKIEASLYQIVAQLRHIVVLFGAYFIFTESITPSKIVSIIVIMLGVAIALSDKARIKITKGIVYAVFNTVCIAFGFLCIKMASTDVKPAVTASISLIGSGLLAYLLLIVLGQRSAKLIPTKHRKELLIAALIFAAFALALYTALKLGEASRVTPVSQSSLIFTLVGAYIFLNERTRLKQKIIGSTLIAAGIGLLYFV